jgi:hypothetical protein
MCHGGKAGDVRRGGDRAALFRGVLNALPLAATPTFTVMALLAAVSGGGPLDGLCAAASPIGGMVPMYLLMGAFHAAPWFKLMGDQPGDSTEESKR